MSSGIVFSKSGVTSWGLPWKWTFGSPIELKAQDGHTLLLTDFHTLEPEYNFEDERYDANFSLSSKQDAEWDRICWGCFQQEFTIYGMAQKGFRTRAWELVHEYREAHPYEMWMPDREFSDMLAACLDAVRAQWGWNSEELEWLFNYGGPLNAAVDEWLVDYLRTSGFEVA